MSIRRGHTVLLAGTIIAMGLGVPGAQAAQPAPLHNRLVPATVRTDTPVINDGEVSDIAVIGNRVFLAGTFTRVRNSNSTTWVNQRYLAAYNMSNGQLDMTFRPTFDRIVTEIEAAPDGQSLYAVGLFNNVSGTTRRKIVKLNLNGSVNTAFAAHANARVNAIDVGVNWVYVGGQFTTVKGVARGRFAAVNPTTGAVDTALDLPVTEGLGVGGLLQVQSLVLTSDESKLLMVHTGHKVDGVIRTGLAMVDTATKSLLPWQTDLFDDNLARVGGVIRVVEGDISPDDSYFVAISGSGGDRPPISDTAMAFPVTGGADVEPLWISRHFDSLYAIAITEVAVYVGGHFRWQEAPGSTVPWPGDDDTAYGANNGQGAAVLGDEVVRRDMIGALDPVTGTSLNWNPGASGLEGVKSLLAVPRGLLLGQDGNIVARQNRGRHAFFDFQAVPPPATIDTFVTDPFEGATLDATQPYVFAGTATAPTGVRRVQLEIKTIGANRYLQDDGVTVSSVWNGINATLSSPNAPDTGWTFTGSPPPGQYQIMAKTYAVGTGNDPTKATVRFFVDDVSDLPPTTSIESPSSGTISTNTFTILGEAEDDVGVNRIRLVARLNETTDYLQNDGTVGPTYNSFTIDPEPLGDPVVTWSHEITLPDGSWRITAAAIDTANQADTSESRADWQVFPTNVPPSVTLDSPTSGTVIVAGTALTITGTAADDVAVSKVEVRVRNLQTAQGMTAGGAYGIPDYHRVTLDDPGAASTTWSVTTPPLPPGVYELRARAYDQVDVVTPSSGQPRPTITSAVPGDAVPDTALTTPGFDQNHESLAVNITGTATDDLGVDRVALVITGNGRFITAAGTTTLAYTEIDATLASAGGTSTGWSLPLTLPAAGRYNITARAVDGSDQYDTSTTNATATWLVFPGDADPTIQFDSPASGASFAGTIPAAGRAFDDVGVARVEIQVVNAGGQYLTSSGTFTTTPTWISAFVTNPNGTATNWNYTAPTVPPGTYTVSARSMDVNGQFLQTPATATGVVVT